MAEDIERAGSTCVFLASRSVCRSVAPRLRGPTLTLGDSLAANRRQWANALELAQPDAIVFADYPLLLYSSGSAPLADEDWVETLNELGIPLITLDHLGIVGHRGLIPFGPPHMTFALEVGASIPDGMQVLLPCPNHDPETLPERAGIPFRCWSPKTYTRSDIAQVRSEIASDEDGILILHSTPAWAAKLASDLSLSHHRYLMPILSEALDGLDKPVTIVSINTGFRSKAGRNGHVRNTSPSPMPIERMERVIAAADLVLTDNAVSAVLGKAVCSGRACAVLVNSLSLPDLYERRTEPGARWAFAIEQERPGAIFPWEVFPIWSRADLDRLGIGRNRMFRHGYARVEMFGGEQARASLVGLLNGDETAQATRKAQERYSERIAELPSPSEALRMALT